jgi:predicted Zn-dependent peptidase
VSAPSLAGLVLAALGAAGPLHLERGADGLELAVLTVPGAPTGALRVLVRTGGADDPPGKDGLAHLVEHLAVEGSAADLPAFRDQARAAGATVNAHTARGWTRFELDAPAGPFPGLAARFLALVTNPQWDAVTVGRQRGVLRTEADYHETTGLIDLVDRAVFPSPRQAGTLVGSEGSRSWLDADQARAFFTEQHRPDRTTIVLAGPLTAAQARALVEGAYAIPPPAGAAPPRPREVPNLPLQQKLQAPVTLAMLGYELDDADRSLCLEVAALLQLRLQLAIQLGGPRVSQVVVECPVLRGHAFLLALAFTSTLDAGDLPGALEAQFTGLATRPPEPRERALVDARLGRRRARLLREPAAAADWISERAAALPEGQPAAAATLLPGALPGDARLRDLARRSVIAERRVELSFSPLQN